MYHLYNFSPQKLKLRYESRDPNFFEVYVENPDRKFTLKLTKENEHQPVWTCALRKGQRQILSQESMNDFNVRVSFYWICMISRSGSATYPYCLYICIFLAFILQMNTKVLLLYKVRHLKLIIVRKTPLSEWQDCFTFSFRDNLQTPGSPFFKKEGIKNESQGRFVK